MRSKNFFSVCLLDDLMHVARKCWEVWEEDCVLSFGHENLGNPRDFQEEMPSRYLAYNTCSGIC